jgi:hypothetical protein
MILMNHVDIYSRTSNYYILTLGIIESRYTSRAFREDNRYPEESRLAVL